MAILVTGGRGMIGSRMIQKFGQDQELISVDLADGFDLLDRTELFRKVEAISQRTAIDAIIHFAAFTDVSAAHAQEGDKSGICYRINVGGTQNVVDLAAEFNSHLVHISTDFVFDGKKEEPVSETDAPNPIEWYGATKLEAEGLVQEHAKSWTILRLAFPYFKDPEGGSDLVSKIRQKLKSDETLYLFDDQWITPTYVDDVVNAANRFALLKPTKEVFHVMGPEYFSPASLGAKLAEIDGISSPDIVATSLMEYLKKDPRPRQVSLKMDTSKFQNFCASNGFQSPVPIGSTLS